MAPVQVLHAVLQSGIRWRVTPYCDSAAGALVRFETTGKAARLLHQQLARWSLLDGAASRIGPCPLRRSLTPPRPAFGSCAAPCMAHSHRFLSRLGELVEQFLFERHVRQQ